MAPHSVPVHRVRQSARSEGEDLIGLDGPSGELVDGGSGCLVDEVFLGETACVEAGPAAGDVAAVRVKLFSIRSRV